MKTTDQITEELMDWLADHHTLRPENEDATLAAVKAVIEKAYRQGGEDTTQAALLLLEARRLLNKWAARYAEADHAKKDRDDSRKCIEAIDAEIHASDVAYNARQIERCERILGI